MELPRLTVAQRRLLAGAIVVALALLLGSRVLGHRAAPASSFAPVRPAAPARPARPMLVVDVVGAVRRPGLYRLHERTRVADAVAAAGGLTAKAERAAVNLAAPLADGQQVLVPMQGLAAGAATGSAPSAPVSLSTATVEQLDALPGIGPATAAKIVAFRQQHGPFRSLDELDAVPGIGAARIEQLRGLAVP